MKQNKKICVIISLVILCTGFPLQVSAYSKDSFVKDDGTYYIKNMNKGNIIWKKEFL